MSPIRVFTRPIVVACAVALFSASCARDASPPGPRHFTTVFATVGDPPTEVDLSPSAADGATFSLVDAPAYATLSGTRLTVTHTAPLHERVRIQIEEHGERAGMLEVWHAVQPAHAPAWPLSISADGRYLIDDDGAAVLWTGDSPWGLAVAATRDEAALYLADRSTKGVNAILIRLIDHKFSDQRPRWLNRRGDPPFERTRPFGVLDFTRPDAEYWEHVDWIIREAYRHGMTVLGAPAYLGYELGDEGWADQMIANGRDRLRSYGEWIADRYLHYPNIVWVMGGDCGTRFGEKVVTEEVDAVAFGIKSLDTIHLMTAHSSRGRSAADDYNRPWLDVNSTYAMSTSVHERVRIDYQRVPVAPTFLIEAYYGNERGTTDAGIRAQMYQAMLGGAFGQLYGNAPQWYFSARAADEFADVWGLNWKDHLDGHGARYLPVIAQLTREYPMERLEPDFDHRVMTSGCGPEDAGYAPVAWSAELAIAYLPDRRSVTFDVSRFRGAVRTLWRSPADGTTIEGRVLPNGGPVTIDPPASGDWILILDARPRSD